jgi:hypothetical protein
VSAYLSKTSTPPMKHLRKCPNTVSRAVLTGLDSVSDDSKSNRSWPVKILCKWLHFGRRRVRTYPYTSCSSETQLLIRDPAAHQRPSCSSETQLLIRDPAAHQRPSCSSKSRLLCGRVVARGVGSHLLIQRIAANCKYWLVTASIGL